jgi:hypothetical protein
MGCCPFTNHLTGDALSTLVVDLLKANFADLQRFAIDCSFARDDRRALVRTYETQGLRGLVLRLDRFRSAMNIGLVTGFLPHIEGEAYLGPYPKLFGRCLSSVFTDDGGLRSDVSLGAIRGLRRLFSFFARLTLPTSEAQEEAEYKSFVFRQFFLTEEPASEDEAQLARDVFAGFSLTSDFCRHGPGAVNDGSRGLDKWFLLRSGNTVWENDVSGDPFWDPTTHPIGPLRPPELTFVPKDAKGPRVICIEPKELMFSQQRRMSSLYTWLEHHPRTRGLINFRCQSVNRSLVQDLSYATIDLSAASDRVSDYYVRSLLPPSIYEYLAACRSPFVLHKGIATKLLAFATMGSALCFPVESFVFWVIAQTVVWNHSRGRAYVYGDDIIVPLDCVHAVLERLRELSHVPNVAKSCYQTPFRESCGLDCFDGHDVSVCRPRVIYGVNDLTPKGMLGLYEIIASPYIGEATRAVLANLLPWGFRPPGFDGCETRHSRRYHRLEWRSLGIRNPKLSSTFPIEGPRFYAWLSQSGTSGVVGRGVVRLQPSWRSVY